MSTINKRLAKILPLMALLLLLLTMIAAAEDGGAGGTGGTSGGKNIFDLATDIIKEVYTNVAGISTVLAGLMSAVAVIGAKLSNNQQKVDQAWDWLKRIWVAWIVINGIGAFIAFIVPLFSGYNTLP